ncbi:MAG: hypothetical protein LBD23_18965 [Oscillospiraceae bacterium]|jgi:hypothetical protein|nr:hypothetical protein [Oscillospiraceae bacterium]
MKRQASITDWSVISYEVAELAVAFGLDLLSYIDSEFVVPDSAFANFEDRKPIALFGRTVNDPRSNPETGSFVDGHRIITTRIKQIEKGIVSTENTEYTLGNINEKYKIWCDNTNVAWQDFDKLSIKYNSQDNDESIYVKREKLPEMKYKLGDIVDFIFDGEVKTGRIVVADYGGALGLDYHSYDIEVENAWYKHIIEHSIEANAKLIK